MYQEKDKDRLVEKCVGLVFTMEDIYELVWKTVGEKELYLGYDTSK
jgi:hypothetical protein